MFILLAQNKDHPSTFLRLDLKWSEYGPEKQQRSNRKSLFWIRNHDKTSQTHLIIGEHKPSYRTQQDSLITSNFRIIYVLMFLVVCINGWYPKIRSSMGHMIINHHIVGHTKKLVCYIQFSCRSMASSCRFTVVSYLDLDPLLVDFPTLGLLVSEVLALNLATGKASSQRRGIKHFSWNDQKWLICKKKGVPEIGVPPNHPFFLWYFPL